MVQLFYRLRRALLGRLRIRTRGVKVMLFNDAGELLLIRNSYGDSALHVLPGGGIHIFETAEHAAARELREEVGIDPQTLRLRSIHHSELEGKRDTIHLFVASSSAAPKIDPREVKDAGFFRLDDLPATTSAATLRRIAEYRNIRPVAAGW